MTRRARGQVSAPIELFVAVIILGMSMALAFSVMQSSSENKCYAELKNNLRGLEAAMVDVAVGSPPTTREVAVTMANCPTTRVEAVRIVYFNDPRYCQACPGSSSGCWKLEPVFKNRQGNFQPISDASVCVNIAGKIELVQDTSPECGELSDTPCPPGTASCDAQTSGIPASVWSASDAASPGTFQTLGRSGNQLTYLVRLRKSVSVTGGEAVGAINICVKNPANG